MLLFMKDDSYTAKLSIVHYNWNYSIMIRNSCLTMSNTKS